MAVIYLTTPGTSLQRRGEHLEVHQQGKKVARLRMFDLERIVVVGPVQISTQALALLLDRGIDVSFMTSRGRPRGGLVSTESRNVYLRLAQFDRWKDAAFRIELGKHVVRAKITGQERVLQRHARSHPDSLDPSLIERIRRLRDSIAERSSIEEIMGVEGTASSAYFQGFAAMLRTIGFPGRKRYPAPDPANALLSLGYVILTNEITGLLTTRGFDPFVGFLHGIRYGRQSLSLDIVEAFRPCIIDRMTLRLFNLRQFTPEHFEGGAAGARLRPDDFKRYLEAYEGTLRDRSAGEGTLTWRDTVAHQVDALKQMVLDGRPEAFYAWPG